MTTAPKNAIKAKTETELWTAYKQHGDMAARDELAERYMGLVDVAAGTLARSANQDKADLYGYAQLGLLSALERFEPGRGVGFATYAHRRIRGQIIDELRRHDFIPRSQRAADREAGRFETVASLDVPRRGYADHEGETTTLGNTLAATNTEIGANLDMEDVVRQLAAAMAELPERDRILMALLYAEGLTYKETAAVLGVSQSAVSHHNTIALKHLLAELAIYRDV